MKKPFCLNCFKGVDCEIVTEIQTVQVRDEMITEIQKIPKCKICGEEIFVDEIEDENFARLYTEYNRRKGENILKIPKENKMNKIRGFELVLEDKRKNVGADIILPKRATKHSIAYDIYSPIDVVIKPMDKCLIWTDVKAYFQPNEALLINVRSSMGKQPVIIAHSQGWIESDYYGNPDNDGNLGVNLMNLGKTDYVIKAGDRIAQCMFINYLVSDNGNTETERKGGFGSTGVSNESLEKEKSI